MKRTQIYIPEEMHAQFAKLAETRRKALAELIREFLAKDLKEIPEENAGKQAMWRLANLNLRGGPKDLSQNLDKYLYGKD
ncbi:MAG: CopG family transcriptional regulator [Patescibacteria group bacterium]